MSMPPPAGTPTMMRTGRVGYGVDDDQPQRQTVLGQQRRLGLAGHGDQVLDGVLVQQHRRGFIPGERCAGHAAAFLTHDSIEAQPDFIGALSRNQQHPTLTLNDVVQRLTIRKAPNAAAVAARRHF